MKIRPVGSELFHADGRTDGRTEPTKLIVAFAILRKRLKAQFCLTENKHIAAVKKKN